LLCCCCWWWWPIRAGWSGAWSVERPTTCMFRRSDPARPLINGALPHCCRDLMPHPSQCDLRPFPSRVERNSCITSLEVFWCRLIACKQRRYRDQVSINMTRSPDDESESTIIQASSVAAAADLFTGIHCGLARVTSAILVNSTSVHT